MFSEKECSNRSSWPSRHTDTGAPLATVGVRRVNKRPSGEIYKLSIDRDELLIRIDSGNRIDRRRRLLNLRAAWEYYYRPSRRLIVVLTPTGIQENRMQPTEYNDVDRPNRTNKRAGVTTTVELAISSDGGDRNSDSHHGRSMVLQSQGWINLGVDLCSRLTE
jgi:hypothetical protein